MQAFITTFQENLFSRWGTLLKGEHPFGVGVTPLDFDLFWRGTETVYGDVHPQPVCYGGRRGGQGTCCCKNMATSLCNTELTTDLEEKFSLVHITQIE